MKPLRKLIALFLIGAMLLPAVVACTDPEEPVTETTTAEPDDSTTTTAEPDDGTTTAAEPDAGTTTTATPDDGATTTAAPDDGTTTTAAPDGGDDDPDGGNDGTTTTAAPDDGTTTAAPDADTTTTAAPVITYTVKWMSDDGTVLETDENVPADAVPTYDGATPTKAGTDKIDYVFDKWSRSKNESAKTVTYTAMFAARVKMSQLATYAPGQYGAQATGKDSSIDGEGMHFWNAADIDLSAFDTVTVTVKGTSAEHDAAYDAHYAALYANASSRVRNESVENIVAQAGYLAHVKAQPRPGDGSDVTAEDGRRIYTYVFDLQALDLSDVTDLYFACQGGGWVYVYSITYGFVADDDYDLNRQINDSRFEIVRSTNEIYTVPDFSSLDEVANRREELQYTVRMAAGLYPWPEKNDMEVVTEEIGTFDGYKVQKIRFETYPGLWSTGNLYLPDPMPEGKVPAVLTLPGHGGRIARDDSNDGRNFPTLDANLAKMGFIVLVTDHVGHLDSAQVNHGYGANEKELWLSNAFGIQLWNNIRALDLLCSMPEVDAENIGVTGNSGGGSQTLFLSLVDDRVKAMAPVGMLSLSSQGGCKCENPALLRRDTNNIEMCALLAPRPLLLAGSTGDWTSNLETRDFPAVLKIYEMYNAANMAESFFQDAGHNYNDKARHVVYNFFARHLMGKDIDWTEQTITYEQEMIEFTWYQNKGQAPGFEDSRAYFAAHKVELAERISTLSDAEKLKMLAWIFDIRENHPDVTVLSTRVRGDVTVEKILLRGDYGEELPVVKMIPANANGKVCLVLSDAGKECLAWEKYRSLLDEGYMLVSGDLFQTGETAGYEQILYVNGRPQSEAITTFHTTFNNTVDTFHVQDVYLLALMASAWGDELTIRAEGDAARAVVCALPLLDCVKAAYVEERAISLTGDREFYRSFFVPGICAFGGFEACLKLVTCEIIYTESDASDAPAFSEDVLDIESDMLYDRSAEGIPASSNPERNRLAIMLWESIDLSKYSAVEIICRPIEAKNNTVYAQHFAGLFSTERGYVYSNLSEQQITSQESYLAHVKPCENQLLEGDADGRYYYKYVFDVSALTDTTALCFAHQGGPFVAIIAARLIP